MTNGNIRVLKMEKLIGNHCNGPDLVKTPSIEMTGKARFNSLFKMNSLFLFNDTKLDQRSFYLVNFMSKVHVDIKKTILIQCKRP